MSRLRKRLTFANVTSALALFFALGGSAFAAAIVTSNADVAPNTIAGHNPGPGKHANLISGSVNNDDIASNTVGGGRIKDATIALSDLAPNSVDGTKVKTAAIGLSDLAADSVDGTKVKEGSIEQSELANESVSAFQLVGTTFYGTGGEHLNDPVGGAATDFPLVDLGPMHVIGRCDESTAGVVTARVIVRSSTLKMSVDSTAPGGANDLPSVPAGTEATLASLGPTTGAHVAVGAFGLMSSEQSTGLLIHPLSGTVSVSTHVNGTDCEFSAVGHG